LNQTTGLDPDGIKLRVIEGMHAADFLIADYWVWERVIHNLADIGYDPNSMYLAAYDWRLSSVNLEKRDMFFTKLKFQVELYYKMNGEKVYIVGHSMGSLVSLFFLKWVESENGGNAGPDWVDKHIQGFVNIAGPILGVPKTISALISGEMRDTAELNNVLDYIKENLVSTSDLLRVFRSFSSLASMIPKGSNKIWGNMTWATEDSPEFLGQYLPYTHGKLVDFVNTEEFEQWLAVEKKAVAHNDKMVVDDDELAVMSCSERPDDVEPIQDADINENDLKVDLTSLTSEGFIEFLSILAPKYLEKISAHDSWGIARDFSDGKYDDPRYWNNPLESQLPKAPNMKLFSLYGVGKATERSYAYQYSPTGICNIPFRIARTVSNLDASVSSGIRLTDGDGTVPLISNGFMGVKGWKDPIYNPSNITSITREYQHLPELLGAGGTFTNRFRGGRTTADHVDILGNHEFITDLLLIVSGHEEKVTDRIFSKIQEMADMISLD